MLPKRILSTQPESEDSSFEFSLRPRSFKDFIGQSRIKENLEICIQAAQKRKEALDHILLFGPPGLGKTTLAHVISQEMKVNIRITSGPVLERSGDLAAILTNLRDRDILFIDEIHRLNPTVEEVLYPAMEEYKIDIIIGQGPSARTVRLPLPAFTLVGATTRAGLITAPLRNRFGMNYHLDFYPFHDLQTIIKSSAKLLKIAIDEEGSREIAKRSRGTPRVANRLLKRVRDYAQVRADGQINIKVAKEALLMLDVDEKGLDGSDRNFLRTIIEKFSGGPVGVETLSAAIGEEKDTIEDVYEPYLIQSGFLKRTPRGRVATESAFQHLNISISADLQSALWGE